MSVRDNKTLMEKPSVLSARAFVARHRLCPSNFFSRSVPFETGDFRVDLICGHCVECSCHRMTRDEFLRLFQD